MAIGKFRNAFLILIDYANQVSLVCLDAKLYILIVDIENAVEIANENVTQQNHGHMLDHCWKFIDANDAHVLHVIVKNSAVEKVSFRAQLEQLISKLKGQWLQMFTEFTALHVGQAYFIL